MTSPVLIFGYGNPGRGDDALGPELVAAIEAEQLPGVECLNDMQLQVEHVTDLEGRERILFVDADESCEPPFLFEKIAAEKDGSYSSHAMSPQALLHAYRQVYGVDVSQVFLLRLRGYCFELGESITVEAAANLDAAMEFVRSFAQPERHAGQ